MAWSWAAHRAASVSPLKPAWRSHILARGALWWALSTALGSVCLRHEANFMRNFCVDIAVSCTIWVSASVLSRMYFAKVDHSQSWVVSTPASPLPLRVQ
eukprot:11149036-Ditylum_brightwellii.AAC.1